MSNYKYTGRSVRLDLNEVEDEVFRLFREYELSENGHINGGPGFDPFTEPIILKNEHGISYQIPNDIQANLIEKWHTSRRMGKKVRFADPEENEVFDEYNNVEIENDIETSSTSTLKYFMYFLVFLVIIYFAYLYGTKKCNI